MDKKLEYVKLMCQSIGDGAGGQRSTLIADTVLGVLQGIRLCKAVTEGEAIQIKKRLEPEVTEAQLNTIMSAIHAKVNLSSCTPTGVVNSDQKQEALTIDALLTEQQWKFFLDPHVDRTAKLMMMAQIFQCLGIQKATERTFAFGAAVATQAHGFDDISQLYTDGGKLKMFAASKVHGHEFEKGPLVYPSTHEALLSENPTIHRQAFPDPSHPPVPSKWNDSQRAMIARHAPCRNTKSGVEKQHVKGGLMNCFGGNSAPKALPGLGMGNNHVQSWSWCAPQAQTSPMSFMQPQWGLQPPHFPALPPPPPPQQTEAATVGAPASVPATAPAGSSQPGSMLAIADKPAWGDQNTTEERKEPTKAAPSMSDITAKIKEQLQQNKASAAAAAECQQEEEQTEPPATPSSKRASANPKSAPNKKAKLKGPQHKQSHKKKKVPNTQQVVRKRPAAGAVSADTKPSNKLPPLPRVGDSPILHKGGKIYVSDSKKGFRVMRVAAQYNTEVFFKWGGKKPDMESWRSALQAIP